MVNVGADVILGADIVMDTFVGWIIAVVDVGDMVTVVGDGVTLGISVAGSRVGDTCSLIGKITISEKSSGKGGGATVILNTPTVGVGSGVLTAPGGKKAAFSGFSSRHPNRVTPPPRQIRPTTVIVVPSRTVCRNRRSSAAILENCRQECISVRH